MSSLTFVIRYDGVDHARIENGQLIPLTDRPALFPTLIEIESSDGSVHRIEQGVTLAELLIIALGKRRRRTSMSTQFAHL